MSAIEIRDLTVLAGKYPLLSRFNLTVEPGETAVFTGHPSDLRHLLQVLSGVTLPEEGEILYYNEPPRRAIERGIVEICFPNAHHFSLPSSPILIVLEPSPLLPSTQQTILNLSPRLFIEQPNKSQHLIKIINLTRRNDA
ncbi:MAG: hypothetical protein LKKZDAJK_002789 [Candidatus Fervidibacter sp.]